MLEEVNAENSAASVPAPTLPADSHPISEKITRIVMLEEIHYPPFAARYQPWHTIETLSPRWAQIEAAVRRLDRIEWPYLHLHTEEPIDGEPPQNSLTVMGGRGEYCVFLTPGGETFQPEGFLTDASRSRTMVSIWESDQGFDVEERYLCRDIEKVLRIARYFAEQAALHPGAIWEVRD